MKIARRPLMRAGLLAASLTLAVSSVAQTPVQWRGTPSGTLGQNPNAVIAAPATVPAMQPVTGYAAAPQPFDVRTFESLAQQLVANQRVPGLAMAIVKDGRILSARGYGITDTRVAEPVDAHTVFRLASLSKAFAGTLTGLLVDEGALRWDTRIVDYYPTFRLADPTATMQLTVGDVLSHRVGITRNAFDRDIEANMDFRSVVQRLATAPMRCGVGQCYAYQNVAFSLIGDVIQGASGQFYDQALTARVLKPLGMNDASVGLEGIEASPRWAKPHVRGGGGWLSLRPKPTYYRVAPAAGVNASASDMAQWLLAQTGHRPDVLSPALLNTLHKTMIDTPTELRGSPWRRERLLSAGYAMGWRTYNYSGTPVVFHGGAVQGYRGVVALLPQQDIGVAILWNSESALPSGLLPTILDSAIGLPYQAWLNLDAPGAPSSVTRIAGAASDDPDASGMEASLPTVSPR